MATVTVTMPTHPFFNQSLRISRIERGQRSKRFITVEHPKDGLLRLPIEWTDFSPLVVPSKVRNIELKAAVRELLKLALACAAATQENIDIQTSKSTLTVSPAESVGTKDGLFATDATALKRATSAANQSLGESCAQSASKVPDGGGL